MSKSKRWSVEGRGARASSSGLLYTVLALVALACGQHDDGPSAATGSAGASAIASPSASNSGVTTIPNEAPPAASSAAPVLRHATAEDIEAASKAYVATHPTQPVSSAASALHAQATAARTVAAKAASTPAFGSPTKFLDLGGPTRTTYPLSVDGKYYKVNLLRRNYPPPSAHATFVGSATQLGQAGPQWVVDGHDVAFTWYPAVAGDATAASKLVVDMGQYFSVGAIRPLYQPLGTQVPANERIRLAGTLKADTDWTEVFNGTPQRPTQPSA